MSLLHLFIIAVVQGGVTEFLPVSSSGHLILIPALTGYQDQGQVIDVAVHLGTLVAVVLFFWADVRAAVGGMPRLLRGKTDTPGGSRLAFLLLASTIPVVMIGFLLKVTGLADAMRSVAVIGWTMITFGVVLWLADKRGATIKRADDWSLRDALIMGGLWQALALIPGTSRSGATISGARALGYAREDGAKLAMLMSIPTIIASGVLLGGIEVIGTANMAAARDGLIAAGFSCVAALLALSLMMRLLKSVNFTPYVIYRVALGGVLLGGIAYS